VGKLLACTVQNPYAIMSSGITTCASAEAPISLECWYKGTDDVGPLVTGRAAGGNPITGLYIGNAGIATVSNTPKFLVRADNASGLKELTASTSSTTLVNDDTWHHIVAVLGGGGDDKGIQLYVDGEIGSSGVHIKNTATTTTRDWIGRDFNTMGGGTHGELDGVIDEVAIYDYALSASRILDHWTKGTNSTTIPSNYVADVLTDGPMGYWQLNDLGGTAVDSSGNNRNGTYTKPSGVQQATGPFGIGDGAFDTTAGTGNYITISDTAFDSIIGGVDQSWTFEIWVDSASSSTLEVLIDKTDISPANWNLMQIRIPAQGGWLDAQTWDGSTNPSALSGSSIHGTGWRHIVMTRATLAAGDSADEVRIYVDGVEEATDAAPGSMNTTNTINLTIGAREEGTDRTTMAVYAHAAVYASALTTARILSHFTTGTTGP
jgi:hypothetical protein